jgi:hypothetical protein
VVWNVVTSLWIRCGWKTYWPQASGFSTGTSGIIQIFSTYGQKISWTARSCRRWSYECSRAVKLCLYSFRVSGISMYRLLLSNTILERAQIIFVLSIYHFIILNALFTHFLDTFL